MLDYSGSMTVNDIAASLEDVAVLMDKAMMPMHTVLDFTGATVNEALLDLITKSRMVHHEQCGHCVFIHPDQFIAFVAEVLRNQTETPVAVVDSEEEAWDFFSEMGIC